MKNKFYILFALLILSANAFAQKDNQYIREGNKQYEGGNFTEAHANYLKAIQENNKNFSGAFNLGNSLYKQEKYEEAVSQYKSIVESAPDKQTKSNAYHNLGNSLLQTKKYQESIDAYKNALRNNPNDEATRHNLAYAMQQLKEEQEQE
ncbi:MAG: tetratricopeptide repeat protein, partial [Bacteroidetes bacterium]|nr:tetratricopeptide repeat protein [Bacteroidota bacterium]